jgi:aminoglycoside phosphotransferase (APT) family kinase protein
MTETEPPIESGLVTRLIASQFPQWANLPVKSVENDGWDNRTFHLGDDMSVRLPSGDGYVLQVEKEQRWLPILAPHLPLPIPAPLAMGWPSELFPRPWSVYRWLEGEVASVAQIADLTEFAVSLAQFLVALRRVDATDGPLPGQHNFFRGAPLAVYDDETRRALVALEGMIDTKVAADVWDIALASRWDRPPVWFQGDVSVGNLLVADGRLSAVIDFGTSGIGDPACDLVIAWALFEGESRHAFRDAIGLDDATWARARGWAIWKAMIVAAGSAGTDSPNTNSSFRVIEEVLADYTLRG